MTTRGVGRIGPDARDTDERAIIDETEHLGVGVGGPRGEQALGRECLDLGDGEEARIRRGEGACHEFRGRPKLPVA